MINSFKREPIKAVTQDGREVVLREDGTWQYSSESQQLIPRTEEVGFRKAVWGATKEYVMEIESNELLQEEPDALFYDGNVAGFDCLIIYIFANNHLVRGKYSFTHQHANANEFIGDYEILKDLLTKKYGRPRKAEVIWLDDLWRDDPSGWGVAISSGGLVYYAEWVTDATDITLILNGDNYEINLAIEYVSKKLGHIENQIREQKTLNEL
jgi:hypothetical protein